jgi:hypothetical protein
MAALHGRGPSAEQLAAGRGAGAEASTSSGQVQSKEAASRRRTAHGLTQASGFTPT